MKTLSKNAPWQLFAFDNYFDDTDRAYLVTERWDIPRALGYDKAYFSIIRDQSASWEMFQAIPEERRRTGLGLAAVYTVVDLDDPQPKGSHSILEMVHFLEPGDTLELTMSVGWQKELSNPARDGQAREFLKPVLEEARKRGVTISLYHHFGFWLERLEDCVRLAQSVNDPNLRVTFCGYHWYAIDRGDLIGKLRLAAPWLHLANVCGARLVPPGVKHPLPATIEPVGSGDFPLGEFINGLREVGFQGDVGFQGYSIGGDALKNLSQSINAFRQAAEFE